MLDALAAGERDPEVHADLALGKLRPKRAELKEALTGRFHEHRAELIDMLLEEVDALTAKIDALTARVTQLIDDIPAAAAPAAKPGPTDPAAAPLAAVARLDEISGIGLLGAQAIIAEVGLNMSRSRPPGTWSPRASSRRAPFSPAHAAARARRVKATSTSNVCSSTLRRRWPGPTRSWASVTGGWSNAAAR